MNFEEVLVKIREGKKVACLGMWSSCEYIQLRNDKLFDEDDNEVDEINLQAVLHDGWIVIENSESNIEKLRCDLDRLEREVIILEKKISRIKKDL